MRHFATMMAVTFLMVLFGCDGGTTVHKQCEVNDECSAMCEGYESFACNEGICACMNEAPIAQCTANADCAQNCEGYENALCSSNGVCFCNDPIPEDVAQCEFDADCAENCTDYDSFSCSGGICYCEDEADVQCVQDDDCGTSCDGADSFSCESGICFCHTTEVLPSCTEDSDCAGKCDAGCTSTCVGDSCVCSDCPDPECPNITRAEMAEYIYNLLGITGCPEDNTEATCNDLPTDLLECQWGKLEERGIFTGMEECRPDDNVNRAEFIKVLMTAVDAIGCFPYPPAEPSFTDTPDDTWYYHSVEAAVAIGSIMPGGDFRPADSADQCFVEEALFHTRTTSYVSVTVYPNDASYTIYSIGDTPNFEDTETGSMSMPIPFGDYQVVFYDLNGYITPEPIIFSSTVCYPSMPVSAIYAPEGNQPAPTLKIDVEDEDGAPFNGLFRIFNDSDEEIYYGSGSTEISGLPVGNYSIVFEHIDSYITPNTILFTLPAEDTEVVVTGVYAVSTFNIRLLDITENTVVKGRNNVEALKLEIETKEDARLTGLNIHFYADADGHFAPSGDRPANQLIASATLFRGDDILAGPEALQSDLSNGFDPFGFDPDSGDHYYVRFDDMNFQIPADSTEELTVKVSLLNTPTEELLFYASLSACGWGDVEAEDADGNSLTVNGYTNDCPYLNGDKIIVLTRGMLFADMRHVYPSSGLLVGGTAENHVSRWRFNGAYEGFVIDKITIVNDLSGAFGDGIENTLGVSQVTIKYQDINSVLQTRTASLSNGKVSFSGLGMYAAGTGEPVNGWLDVYADVPTVAEIGDSLSGQQIRLGLKTTDLAVNEFSAFGAQSGGVIFELDEVTGWNEGVFVVRKTRPYLSQVTGLNSALDSGTNRLYGVHITADDAGPVQISKISFAVSSSIALSNFELRQGSTLIPATFNVNGTIVEVTFNMPESVTAGETKTYYLDATATGVQVGDYVNTSFGYPSWSDGIASNLNGFGLEDLDSHTLEY